MNNQQLEVTSTDFKDGDWIPIKNTARGDDQSPQFELNNITDKAVTLAITMDDSSHPLFPDYNHWLIWNIPIMKNIPSAIPQGKTVESLNDAKQGRAYGRHRYKGPKPPLKCIHTYTFTFYILDCLLDLSVKSRKKDLLSVMNGHILQQATISGKYQSKR